MGDRVSASSLIWIGFFSSWVVYAGILVVDQILAQRSGRRRQHILIADRVWISGFLLQALGIVAVLFFPRQRIFTLELAIGAAITTAALLFTLWALRTTARRRSATLIKRGPYRRVRHPLAGARLAMTFATGLGISRWWALAGGFLFALVGIEISIRAEDRILRRHLGSEFDAYQRQVKAYLPFIR